MNRNQVLLLLLSVFCVGTMMFNAGAQGTNRNPVVLMIDRGSGGFLYIVDGKLISKSLSPELLMRVVGEKLPKNQTKPAPMILLVHDQVDLGTIENVRGIVMKVGYFPRIFNFNREKTRMIEISFSQQAVPFSADGKIQGNE